MFENNDRFWAPWEQYEQRLREELREVLQRLAAVDRAYHLNGFQVISARGEDAPAVIQFDRTTGAPGALLAVEAPFLQHRLYDQDTGRTRVDEHLAEALRPAIMDVDRLDQIGLNYYRREVAHMPNVVNRADVQAHGETLLTTAISDLTVLARELRAAGISDESVGRLLLLRHRIATQHDDPAYLLNGAVRDLNLTTMYLTIPHTERRLRTAANRDLALKYAQRLPYTTEELQAALQQEQAFADVQVAPITDPVHSAAETLPNHLPVLETTVAV